MHDIGDFQVAIIAGTESVRFRCRPCDSTLVVSLDDPIGRLIAGDFCGRHAHPDEESGHVLAIGVEHLLDTGEDGDASR